MPTIFQYFASKMMHFMMLVPFNEIITFVALENQFALSND